MTKEKEARVRAEKNDLIDPTRVRHKQEELETEHKMVKKWEV